MPAGTASDRATPIAEALCKGGCPYSGFDYYNWLRLTCRVLLVCAEINLMDAFLIPSSVPRVRPPAAARVAVAMLFFMNGALFASWVARIPAIRSALGLSHATLGLVLLAAALGALIAMPVAGWCVSRFGSRRVSQIAAIVFGAILPGLALAPNASLLALSLLFLGAGNGALDVAMNAQAVAVEKCYGRPILSSFHGLWSLGALSGAGIGGLAAAAQITPLKHFSAAALLLGGATAAFALPRLIEAGDAQRRQPPGSDGERRKFVWPSPALLALGALAFCIMLGEGAMADWSAIFLREICGVGEGWAAAGYAAFALAMAAARFSGDSLSARFGPVTWCAPAVPSRPAAWRFLCSSRIP